MSYLLNVFDAMTDMRPERSEVAVVAKVNEKGAGIECNGGKNGEKMVTFVVYTNVDAYSSLGVIGNTDALGQWDLSNMIRLKAVDGGTSCCDFL